jgi:hypothetical protein
VLADQGREAPFGQSGHGLRYVLSALSPSDRIFGWVIGIPSLVLGFFGLWQRWGEDDGARLLLPFAGVMVLLTVLVGREYWSLTFGPALACYVPAALTELQDRRPERDGTPVP